MTTSALSSLQNLASSCVIPPMAIDLEAIDTKNESNIKVSYYSPTGTDTSSSTQKTPTIYSKFIRPEWFERLNPVELNLQRLAKGPVVAASLFSKGTDIIKNNPLEYSEYTQKLNKLFKDAVECNNLTTFKEYYAFAIQNKTTSDLLKKQLKENINADTRMLELMKILEIAPL